MEKRSKINTFEASDLTKLYYKYFQKDVKVIVKKGDADQDYGPFVPGKFDREHIKEIHIQKPGEYASSADGKMIFRLTKPGDILALYLGDERDTDVEIPDNVKYIGCNAFEGCSLQSVKIPDSVQVISSWSFGEQSPEEIDLPASVKIAGISSLCTSNIIHVHDRVNGLIDAVTTTGRKENLSENFCVEYRNRWHIFPRHISINVRKKVEDAVYDEAYKEGIYNHFELADFVDNKLKCAYEIFRSRRDSETENYLRSNIRTLCTMACKSGEEGFINFLKEFRGYGMLDENVLREIMEKIDDRWTQAKACLLDTAYSCFGLSNPCFEL